MQQLKKGLGKGLGVLLEHSEVRNDIPENFEGIVELDIHKIEPNKQQPRRYFDEESLLGLSESLKEFGVIQPIIVKKTNGFYSIIAGERRWRAARIAKLDKIPAIVKEYNSDEILQIALIENLQRQDLNPIEEALCYKRLTDEYFFTQEAIGKKIGKSRNTISNAVTLLSLDSRVQEFIIEGKLTQGNARPLLQIKDSDIQFEFAKKIIEHDLNIKDTEKLIKLHNETTEEVPKEIEIIKENIFDRSKALYANLENDLKDILGTKVSIKNKKNKGKIEIEYYSPEELDRLLGIFKKIES